MEWINAHKDSPDEEIKEHEQNIDNAYRNLSACRVIKSQWDYNLKRIKTGAWVYFEHKNVIDKIWALGYDAIQLSEREGIPTTLAVREGTNQIKSVDNKGTWDKSENIYEHLNRLFKELL